MLAQLRSWLDAVSSLAPDAVKVDVAVLIGYAVVLLRLHLSSSEQATLATVAFVGWLGFKMGWKWIEQHYGFKKAQLAAGVKK